MQQTTLWFGVMICIALIKNVVSVTTSIEALDAKPKKCSLERIAKMMGYTCSDLNIKDIPQSLKSGIEVLDMSHNRIRELTVASFSRYQDIKYLYLFENIIMDIEKGTFKQLDGLEALDLSYNGITTVPIELFEMPKLRNLYLQGNKLIHFEMDLAKVQKPITAPLQILNLASTHLFRIPDFGILPDLWSLNVSGNPLMDINTVQFSPICNLKTIDFNESSIPTCQCHTLNRYLLVRLVMIENLNCDLDARAIAKCPRYEDMANETIAYYKCLDIRESRAADQMAKSNWLVIAAALIGFLIVFTGFLWVLHRRNVSQIKRRQSLFVKGISIKHDNGQPEKLIIEKPEKEPPVNGKAVVLDI